MTVFCDTRDPEQLAELGGVWGGFGSGAAGRGAR